MDRHAPPHPAAIPSRHQPSQYAHNRPVMQSPGLTSQILPASDPTTHAPCQPLGSFPATQISYQLMQEQNQQHLHLLQEQNRQQIEGFWMGQMQEVEQVVDFKNHHLPLARIKKIMKADEDVRMISAEAPVLFAKACEMFILELTLRSWIHTEESKRRTLQKNDIAAAITRTDIFDFLVDIVPREDVKDEGLRLSTAAASAEAIPYGDLYYTQAAIAGLPMLHPQQAARSAIPADSTLYGHQHQHQHQHQPAPSQYIPQQPPARTSLPPAT